MISSLPLPNPFAGIKVNKSMSNDKYNQAFEFCPIYLIVYVCD